MKRYSILIALTALLAGSLVGCGGEEQLATAKEEEAFRNPPKEIPPENLAAMQKAREEGMRKAAEMRAKAQGQ